ncbi:MAG: hypothetical protein ACXVDJ_06825, partial [Tumebacillaceae bacterium]
ARTNSVTIDSTKVTIVITDQAVLDMLKNPPDPTLSSASVKIDSASNCLSNCQYTVFIVAGIDTTSCKASSDDCFFLDGMMKVPTRLLSGKSVKVVDLYPYGTSDNFMSDDWLTDAEWLTFVLAQVATIKSDMTLSPYLSVGGHFVANAAMNSKVNGGINSKFVFLGHSGGGVASYLGAQLLEHDNGKTVQQVVQIGSPIMDFDSINYPNLAAKTDFVYANNFGDDPVPILGLLSQQVGPPSGYRFGSQNPRNIRSVKIAPQSNPMSIHMSYFWDTNWTDSSGTWHNNIDSLYDLISPWVQ